MVYSYTIYEYISPPPIPRLPFRPRGRPQALRRRRWCIAVRAPPSPRPLGRPRAPRRRCERPRRYQTLLSESSQVSESRSRPIPIPCIHKSRTSRNNIADACYVHNKTFVVCKTCEHAAVYYMKLKPTARTGK